MNRQGKISASLMCADLMNIEKQVRLLEEARIDYLHIDIMDGGFVVKICILLHLLCLPIQLGEVRNYQNYSLEKHKIFILLRL